MATITVGFANAGAPATGLAPTIRIRRTDTQALVVTDAAMTEQGDGAYSYSFAPTDGLDYSIRADGTATLADAERYAFGSISGSNEARLGTDIPAILVDSAALDSRLTAPRAALLDDLANLDVAVSTRGTADTGDAMALTPSERSAVDAALTGAHGAGAWTTGSGTPLTAQQTRDAMKLAPTGGAPIAGSVDSALDAIEADTAAIEPLTTANLDAAITSRGTANAGDAMALTPSARSAIDAELSGVHGAGAWTGGGLTAQQTRDAMKLAPTAGAPSAGSVDASLGTIEADAAAVETRTVDLLAALAFFGAATGVAVTHTPTSVSVGGFTWSVAVSGPNVTFTRLT